jgi:hypothetical protein
MNEELGVFGKLTKTVAIKSSRRSFFKGILGVGAFLGFAQFSTESASAACTSTCNYGEGACGCYSSVTVCRPGGNHQCWQHQCWTSNCPSGGLWAHYAWLQVCNDDTCAPTAGCGSCWCPSCT